MTLACTQPAAPIRSPRLFSIEVVRGFACAAVLLFHSLTALPADSLSAPLRALRGCTEFGWLGVYAFFAVSGWCVAERLSLATRRRESAIVFWRERILRIYPTYWAALILLLAVRAAALPFNTANSTHVLPSGVTAWIGDLLLLQPYLGTEPLLIVSWSLVYELGFYSLAAGALMLWRKQVPTIALIWLGALAMLAPTALWTESRLTYVLGLWPDFFFGVLAWRASRSLRDRTGRLSALLLLGGAVVTFLSGGPSGSLPRAISATTALLLWWAARHDARLAKFSLLQWFARLGRISYSLYLVHLVALSPALNLSQRFIGLGSYSFVALWALIVGASVCLGWCFHRWIELPTERWRRRHFASQPVV